MILIGGEIYGLNRHSLDSSLASEPIDLPFVSILPINANSPITPPRKQLGLKSSSLR